MDEPKRRLATTSDGILVFIVISLFSILSVFKANPFPEHLPMKTIDKLAWIEIKDNRILLTKSFGKDKFYIPGGKREIGETDSQALSREIREELSVVVDTRSLSFMGVFEAQAHGQPEGVLVKMTCYTGDYSGKLQANAEIETIRWFSYAEKDQVVGVDQLIFDDLNKKKLLN